MAPLRPSDLLSAHHDLLHGPDAASVVVVVMVTCQDLPHLLVTPDDTEEAAPKRSEESAICRTGRRTAD